MRLLLTSFGTVPCHQKKTIRVKKDDCTINILNDIQFMSTETLEFMKDKCTPLVKHAMNVELTSRKVTFNWHTTNTCVKGTEDIGEFIEESHHDIDDDFYLYGEDYSKKLKSKINDDDDIGIMRTFNCMDTYWLCTNY